MNAKFFHRYLGLLLSIVMLVISVTGVLLIWKKEYLMLVIPQAREMARSDNIYIAKDIEAILASYEKNRLSLIQINHEGLGIHKAILTGNEYAFFSQQGEKIQQWASNGRIEDWLLDLHHRFLLGNTIGLNIAGFGGMLLLPLLVLGLFIWWPRRRTYRLRVLPSSTQRGDLMRSHGNIGISSILAFLIISISGVILVYPRQSSEVLLDLPLPQHHVSSVSLSRQEFASTQSILGMLDYAKKQYPNSTIRWYRPPTENYAAHIIGLQQEAGLNRMGNTHVTFLSDGSVSLRNALIQAPSKRLFDFMFPIHTAKLPMWYRVLLSLFGIALALVSMFGLGSYFKSFGRKKIKAEPGGSLDI